MITGRELLKGTDYVINDNIRICNLKISDIIEFGVQQYFDMVFRLCGYPFDFKDILDENEIDYTQFSDFDVFCLINLSFKNDDTSILLGDLDFSKLQLVQNNETMEMVLAQGTEESLEPIIDQRIYSEMIDCIRKIHGYDGREGKMFKHILKTFSSTAHNYLDLSISTFIMLVKCGAIIPKLEVVLDNNQKGKDDKINR